MENLIFSILDLATHRLGLAYHLVYFSIVPVLCSFLKTGLFAKTCDCTLFIFFNLSEENGDSVNFCSKLRILKIFQSCLEVCCTSSAYVIHYIRNYINLRFFTFNFFCSNLPAGLNFDSIDARTVQICIEEY